MQAPASSSSAASTVVVHQQPVAGDPHVPAADAAALSLVFLLIFCVACFAWGAAILGRRERQMLESEDANPKDEPQENTSASQPPSSSMPWEREPDWWKRG